MKRFVAGFFYCGCFCSFFFVAQVTGKTAAPFNAASRPKNLSDSALLDFVQKQTFGISGILLIP